MLYVSYCYFFSFWRNANLQIFFQLDFEHGFHEHHKSVPYFPAYKRTKARIQRSALLLQHCKSCFLSSSYLCLQKKGCCIISILWRKDRDSNPGTRQAGQRFSRPPRSTTPASFLDKQDFTAIFSSLKPSFSVCKDSNFFSYARKKIFLRQILFFSLSLHFVLSKAEQ